MSTVDLEARKLSRDDHFLLVDRLQAAVLVRNGLHVAHAHVLPGDDDDGTWPLLRQGHALLQTSVVSQPRCEHSGLDRTCRRWTRRRLGGGLGLLLYK